MVNFEFFNPVKVIFGAGEVAKTGIEVKGLGTKALLVSYTEYSFMTELLDSVTADMQEQGVEVVPFYNVVANPLVSTVEKAVKLCREQNIEVIVAIGGGSVADTAKLIAAGVKFDGPVWDMVESGSNENVHPAEDALPTVVISTIPATSSEMNCIAVISNEETKEKAHMASPCIYPKVSILDPELTCSLPPYQTGCGIADAISHVMEPFLNGSQEAPLQEYTMTGVVRTLIEYAPKVLETPNDVNARGQIQWAACVAWNGWTHTGIDFTAPMHMISHPLSARHGIAHGATLSMIMPAFMRYTYKHNLKQYKKLAKDMLDLDIRDKDDETIAVDAIDAFEAILVSLGVPTRLSECNVTEADLDVMIDDCVRVAFDGDQLTAYNPLTKEDIKNIMMLAL